MNKLAIVMLNWNGHKDTIECIESIRINEENRYAIFLLDNGSKLESVNSIKEWLFHQYKDSYEIVNEDAFLALEDFSQVGLYFIEGKNNLGFAKGNNLIWNKINEYFNYTLLLNNDTIITKNSLSNMVNYMDNHRNTGVLSCDIRYYSNPDKLWNAGGYFTFYGDRKYIEQKKIDDYKKNGIEVIKTPFVTGCVLMARREIVEKYGVFSEKFFFGEEDFNYCMRLLNKEVLVESLLTSTVYHKVGTSVKKTQGIANSMILHFSNRIINLKEFYSPSRWTIWRIFYMTAIFFKALMISKEFKVARKVIKNINYYTNTYDEISYNTYIEISRL